MGETVRVGDEERAARPWWRRAAAVLAVLLLVGSGGVVALRLLGTELGPLTYVVSLVPWLLTVTAAALVLALVGRTRGAALTATILLVVQAWWLLPLVTAETPRGDRPLVIASSNIRFGDGSADDLVALVRSREVDVLVVLELTPEAMRRLERAGLDDLLPERYAEPEPGVQGTGIWSRLPLSGTRRSRASSRGRLART